MGDPVNGIDPEGLEVHVGQSSGVYIGDEGEPYIVQGLCWVCENGNVVPLPNTEARYTPDSGEALDWSGEFESLSPTKDNPHRLDFYNDWRGIDNEVLWDRIEHNFYP